MSVKIFHGAAQVLALNKEIYALFELMPDDYSVGVNTQGLYYVDYGLKRIHIPSHLSKDYDIWAKAFQEVAAP